MIHGAHFLLYSTNPEADRGFLLDVLGFRGVDAGEGWLIFKLPPAEVGVHPSEGAFVQRHADHDLLGCVLYLMCDEVRATVKWLEGKGAACSPLVEAEWGHRDQRAAAERRARGPLPAEASNRAPSLISSACADLSCTVHQRAAWPCDTGKWTLCCATVEVKVSSCAKNAELAAVVQGVLAKIVDLTKEQSAAFEKRNHGQMMRLDNQLENAIGEKERAIGAWNEHRKEHGC